MSSAKITLIGFYKLFDSMGDDLFKYLNLPDGIEKDILTDNILLKGGEFEVIFSDPEFLQLAIKSWSGKWNRTFTKWIEALNIEYSPLENYDRIEEWNERSESNSSESGTQTGTVTDSGSNTGTVKDVGSSSGSDSTTGTSSGNTNNKISAFNSSALENDSQSSNSATNSNSSETSASTTNTRTDNLLSTNTRTDDLSTSNDREGSISSTKSGRTHGNVGVTTSQQMLESELNIAAWNIYEHITDIFLSEFVIPIY